MTDPHQDPGVNQPVLARCRARYLRGDEDLSGTPPNVLTSSAADVVFDVLSGDGVVMLVSLAGGTLRRAYHGLTLVGWPHCLADRLSELLPPRDGELVLTERQLLVRVMAGRQSHELASIPLAAIRAVRPEPRLRHPGRTWFDLADGSSVALSLDGRGRSAAAEFAAGWHQFTHRR